MNHVFEQIHQQINFNKFDAQSSVLSFHVIVTVVLSQCNKSTNALKSRWKYLKSSCFKNAWKFCEFMPKRKFYYFCASKTRMLSTKVKMQVTQKWRDIFGLPIQMTNGRRFIDLEVQRLSFLFSASLGAYKAPLPGDYIMN